MHFDSKDHLRDHVVDEFNYVFVEVHILILHQLWMVRDGTFHELFDSFEYVQHFRMNQFPSTVIA